MAKVAIVGAGVMGSALTIPLSDNGHQVALCGTEFDRAVIDRLREDGWHPAMKMRLPESVRPFHVEELGEAVQGSQVVVLGVISGAVGKMAERVAPFLSPGAAIVNVAKGLEVTDSGELRTLPQIVAEALPQDLAAQVAVVAIGGPSKALELADRRPTCVVFASEQEDSLRRCARIFATDYYHLQLTTDIRGLEVCAAIKNGYAIGVGICDGIAKSTAATATASTTANTMDNLRSAVFNQAVHEMAALTPLLGGQAETAYGLGGLGDLYVTCQQGRNLTLGQLLGEGLSFDGACEAMKGATVEGIEAIRVVHRALEARMEQRELRDRFPLLDCIQAVLFRQSPVSLPLERFFGP